MSTGTPQYPPLPGTAIPQPAPTLPPVIGWICPQCKRGMAPWASYCDCSTKYEVTC